jgi:choice-of-anchor A domain-containing protein
VLIVGGDVDYSGGSVKNGNVVYGGTAIALPSIPNGIARQEANPLSSSTEAWVTSVSAAWKNLATNGDVSLVGTTLTLSGPATIPPTTRYVFNVSGDALAKAKTVNINLPSGSGAIVVINISNITNTQEDRLLANSISLSGTDSQRVVFNFYEAMKLTVDSGTVPGTIWAPLANVTISGGPINGSVLAKSLLATSVSFNGPSYLGPLP